MIKSRSQIKREFLLANPPRGAADEDPNKKAADDEAAAIAARAAQTPPPEYMTATAFAEYQRQQDERFEKLTERLVSAVQPRETPRTEPVINYDAEIAKAEEEGNSGRATELRIAKANKPLLDRIANFENFGVTQLESISSEVALSSEGDRKLYQRYKKEVDTVRAGMPPNFRTSPESLRTALTFVKGQHIEELMNEDREARARQAVKPDAPVNTPSSTVSSRQKKPDRLPTPEEYFAGQANSEKLLANIDELGGADAYVKKVSGGKYTKWETWVERSLKLVGKPVPEKKSDAA